MSTTKLVQRQSICIPYKSGNTCKCGLCGNDIINTIYINKIDKDKGNIENCIPICAICKGDKGSMTIEEYRDYIESGVDKIRSAAGRLKLYHRLLRYGFELPIQFEVKFYFETLNLKS